MTFNPISTYRIQFNAQFKFSELRDNLEYFKLLGIKSIYASPVFSAVKGSMHGYNVTGPNSINEELGNQEDFIQLTHLFRENGIGWIQDIVPNHMAFHPENPWLYDVLEKGKGSDFLHIFDIEESVFINDEKLMLPFLGSHTGEAMESGEISLTFREGKLLIVYHDYLFPGNFESYLIFFLPHLHEAPESFKELWSKYDAGQVVADSSFLNGAWKVLKRDTDELINSDPEVREFVDYILAEANKDKLRLMEILSAQHYALCHWGDTSTRINYRRFFTVNDLICTRADDSKVFNIYHQLPGELLNEGVISGLRVDHIDGIREPGLYLRHLRSLSGEDAYIVVEKILEESEQIPSTWPVQGTTGYDFLALVNNLFSNKDIFDRLRQIYRDFTGQHQSPELIIYESRKMILTTRMAGELHNLNWLLSNLTAYSVSQRYFSFNKKIGLTPETMKEALAEFMLALPVYRLYPDEFPLNESDREVFLDTFRHAMERNPGLSASLQALKELLLTRRNHDNKFIDLLSLLILRCMQFTGPLAAKGVEDTAMYRYNCHIAHNEVGDNPGSTGISSAAFHEAMQTRLKSFPIAMNSTSTHDTKRGEDSRARLNALTGLADEWGKYVEKWGKLNSRYKGNINDGQTVPSPNEEYLIYQSLAGSFPFNEEIDATYLERFCSFLVKALREAGENSSWEQPDEKYEQALSRFVHAILSPGNPFLKAFLPFQRQITRAGIVTSLAQLAVKCMAPGIPDIYRGTENWDISFVDPDNRRPYDIQGLHSKLKEILNKWNLKPGKTIQTLMDNAHDGRIKLLFTYLFLNERKKTPSLFLQGEYIPLKFSGKYRENVFGFMRKYENTWMMCVVPLNTGKYNFYKKNGSYSGIKWKDTAVIVPEEAPTEWENIFNGEKYVIGELQSMDELFSPAPVIILKGSHRMPVRRAGILLHISSLPGKFGMGDFGEEAFRFVDFLKHTRQSFWQILPLSPVSKNAGWSPYSSASAFAGNTLFISPEGLHADGLLANMGFESERFKNKDYCDFNNSEVFREKFLRRAWIRFNDDNDPLLHSEFNTFCEKENYWLDDYTLFLAYREELGGKEWRRWPAAVRDREGARLEEDKRKFTGKILYEKFKQFIFFRQWNRLKRYANDRGIGIFGDIPYYVSYDSADVWANQGLFKLKDDKKMDAVAGVPPDYFDAGGQLWNMPVYRLDKMNEDGYTWWIRRLQKNMELFDLLRLDHFRAFSEYWEVPAGDKTAVNGTWKPGPGREFLTILKEKFPEMPFVAEDLGDIDQKVYDLKDEFGLPGMQVLQFGFGRGMTGSIHTVHNHSPNSLVYTGTHDNNTAKGWFEKELDKQGKSRLQNYTGKKIKAKDLPYELIRMAFQSSAKIAIIPMQDYLGLDSWARMNTPATGKGNWLWKMKTLELKESVVEGIRRGVGGYNRG